MMEPMMNPDLVETRADLVAFVDEMSRETSGWENNTLDVFLEALSGWVADMDGWSANNDRPVPTVPTWGLIAQMLAAATEYE
jgi:hypothetical protein